MRARLGVVACFEIGGHSIETICFDSLAALSSSSVNIPKPFFFLFLPQAASVS
jgi:hypothetical protein